MGKTVRSLTLMGHSLEDCRAGHQREGEREQSWLAKWERRR